MKDLLTKNIGLKIVSLVAAVILWAVVVNVSNPEIKATKQVTVEVRNDDIITSAGKTYELENSTQVMISYNVRTRDAYKINASDFRAYVDMEDLYAITGSVPIIVEVNNHKDLVSDVTAKPNIMHVNVEDIVKLTKDIEYELDGTPQDGYTVGSVELNPSSISISGPASVVTQIKTVKVVIDVDGITEDLSGSTAPLLVDSIGRTVNTEDKEIKINHSKVNYTVGTLIGKTVPVQYEVGGSAAEGYSFTGISASINQVAIRGSKAALAEINSIVVPASVLDLAGTNSNKEIAVDLSRFVPNSLEIVGDCNAVVTLLVEGQEEKHFTISSTQIAVANGYEGCNYTVEPITLDVVLTGLRSDLDTLDPHMILGSVDVAEILEEGIHAVEIQFTLPAGYSLKSYTPVTVKLIGQPVVETLEGEEGETEILEGMDEENAEDEEEVSDEESESDAAETEGNLTEESTETKTEDTAKETEKETTKETKAKETEG